MPINSKFLDVDFEKQPYTRGYLPRQEALGESRAVFGNAGFNILQPDQYKSVFTNSNRISLKKCVGSKKNQKSEGSCVGNATTSAVEVRSCFQLGVKKHIRLSAISLYRLCGRSPSSGSSIECNISKASEIGILPSSNNPEALLTKFKYAHPDTGYYTKPADGWQTEANYFRIDETFDISSVAEFITAIALGFPVVYARSMHCILGVDFDFSASDTKPALIYLNSWGEDWGDEGYGYDSYNVWSRAVVGAVAVKSVTIHPISYDDEFYNNNTMSIPYNYNIAL